MNEDLTGVARDYWDLHLETTPSIAPLENDYRFCGAIEDWSESAESSARRTLRRLRERVDALPADTLESGDRVTAGLLRAEIDEWIESIDLRLIELASDHMTGPHAMYLQLPPQSRYPDPDHAEQVIDRYRQLPGSLDGLLGRFRAGVEHGRTPARRWIERSLSQLDGYLASDRSEDVFATVQGPEAWDGEAAWRRRLSTAIAEHVRPGIRRFRAAIATELLPVARGDDEAGLCHLDEGDQLYRVAIRRHTSLPFDADELHRIGLDEIASLRDEYRSLGSDALGTSDLATIFERLRTDPDLRYADRDAILRSATESLDRAKRAMGDWFGLLPRSDCAIEAVPAFMEAAAPPAYYWPPSPDGDRPGTYYVNTHRPEEQSRVEAESIGFHESIPGHHLQIAIASELPDLPMFQRRSTAHTAYVEGWGLYAERLADEMGLYSSPLDRMGMLVADSWRAGRLVVDTGIHARGWSRRRAVDWMLSNTPVAPDTIGAEIDRYIAMPGQALAYKIGQRELFRLRRDAADRLGEQFRIRDFHDAVLGSGTVSLPILAELIDDFVADRRYAA